jgi:hypothetical protein
MGARCNTGNTGTRKLNLYEWFTDALVATATVDFTGKVANEYAWASIAPTTLAAGGYYALMMEATVGMQPWSNPGPVTLQPSITNIYDCYRSGTLQTGLANQMFAGLDLGWN